MKAPRCLAASSGASLAHHLSAMFGAGGRASLIQPLTKHSYHHGQSKPVSPTLNRTKFLWCPLTGNLAESSFSTQLFGVGVHSALKSPSIFVFFLVNEPVSNVSNSGKLKLSIRGKLFLIMDDVYLGRRP
jgi:hypothetical protein